jgi:hypothetical protein
MVRESTSLFSSLACREQLAFDGIYIRPAVQLSFWKHIFICGLFKDAVSILDYIARNVTAV